MASLMQSNRGGEQREPAEEDHRHPRAARPNNLPAALTIEGRMPASPCICHAYDLRIDPVLRSYPSPPYSSELFYGFTAAALLARPYAAGLAPANHGCP